MEKEQSNSKLFSEQIDEKAKLKLKAQKESKSGVWLGLGMFGMIGWSVVAPALLGAAIGIWLDQHYRESFSWTLSGLILGLAIGCVIAWFWVDKENKNMHQKN